MSSDELSARGVHVVVLQHRRCRRRCRRRPWSSVVAARLAIALIGAGATTADARCGHALVHARIHSQVARMVRFLSLHLQIPRNRPFFRTRRARCRAVECVLFIQRIRTTFSVSVAMAVLLVMPSPIRPSVHAFPDIFCEFLHIF